MKTVFLFLSYIIFENNLNYMYPILPFGNKMEGGELYIEDCGKPDKEREFISPDFKSGNIYIKESGAWKQIV